MTRWTQEQGDLLRTIVEKLDALIGALRVKRERRLPTYVRCSCGQSAVVVWNDASQSYQGPRGWVFDWEENGGWTCGTEGHKAAEAHYLIDYDRDPVACQDDPRRP